MALLGCAALQAAGAAAEGDSLQLYPEATARSEGFIGQTFVQGFAPPPGAGQPTTAHSVITHLGREWAEGDVRYTAPTPNAPASYEVIYNWVCPDGGVYDVGMTFPDGVALSTQLTIPAHPCRRRWRMRTLHARVGHRAEAVIVDTWSKFRPYRDTGERERACVTTSGATRCSTFGGGASHAVHLPAPHRAGQLYALTLAEASDPHEVQRLSFRARG
jgi:hypothetical protein